MTITVTPSNSGQDPELFLMSSDASTPGTFVRGRVSAVASSTGHGAGAAESFTFTPTVGQWYGIVVTSKAGSGNLTPAPDLTDVGRRSDRSSGRRFAVSRMATCLRQNRIYTSRAPPRKR